MPKKKNSAEETTSQNRLTKETEEERLYRDIFRPDIEKLMLFTKMLRTNALYKKAVITHK